MDAAAENPLNVAMLIVAILALLAPIISGLIGWSISNSVRGFEARIAQLEAVRDGVAKDIVRLELICASCVKRDDLDKFKEEMRRMLNDHGSKVASSVQGVLSDIQFIKGRLEDDDEPHTHRRRNR